MVSIAPLSSRVDKIEAMIDDLESRATDYWRISPGDPRLPLLASDVKRFRSRIGNEISRLDQLGFACGKSCNPLVADFNYAATGEMFEVRDRPAQPYRGARISDAAAALQKQLRDVLKIV